MKRLVVSILLIASIASLSYCGGGGGGGGNGSSDPAAFASIALSPSNIDSGDRTTVTARVEDVNELGIALKIRFPSGLSFVTDSGQLVVDDNVIAASPTFNKTADSKTYLVFYLSQSDFGKHNKGRVVLILQGKSLVKDGLVEIDADVNDPNVEDSKEFSVADPKFDAQDGADVDVRDSSAAATATPTASPTPSA